MINYEPIEIGNIVAWFDRNPEKYWIGTVTAKAAKDLYSISWSNGHTSLESTEQVLSYKINLDYLIERQDRNL